MRGDLEKLLADKDDATIRNNLGFCQIISGEIVKGLENINRAIAHEYAPLFEMNKGIANYLVNGPEEAKKSLRNALKELQTPGNSYEPDASYLLVLDSDGKKVTAHPDH